MSNQVLRNGLGVLEFTRGALLGLAEDVPDDKLCHQPVAGGNHALWILGHIAYADNYFMTSLSKKESGLSADWDGRFGVGSTPTGDVGDYPSLDEVKASLSDRREALVGWFKSMSEEQLNSALPKDYESFGANYGALMSTIAWHEGMHSGQLTMIRKSLGIGPKFG